MPDAYPITEIAYGRADVFKALFWRYEEYRRHGVLPYISAVCRDGCHIGCQIPDKRRWFNGSDPFQMWLDFEPQRRPSRVSSFMYYDRDYLELHCDYHLLISMESPGTRQHNEVVAIAFHERVRSGESSQRTPQRIHRRRPHPVLFTAIDYDF